MPRELAEVKIRLRYSPVNAAFLFMYGDQPLRMEGFEMFYSTKAEAKEAARYRGLKVLKSGIVVVAEA